MNIKEQVTFNFQKWLAPMVEDDRKTTTIRIFARSNPPKAGRKLGLFTGMRTKACRKLLSPICRGCLPIQITETETVLNGAKLSPADERQLAIGDGFKDAEHMRSFFRKTYGLPLPQQPHLVRW